MARPLELTPEDAEFERDPAFRLEVVDNIIDAAENAGIVVDARCRGLLQQYADGAIDCVKLHHEIGRPVLH